MSINTSNYNSVWNQNGSEWNYDDKNKKFQLKDISHNVEEIDLLQEVERKYQEDSMRRLALCNEAWIREYRLKMFRNVLNNGRMPKK
jgi:hypothetical protein